MSPPIPQGSRVDLIDRLGRPLLRLCGVAFVVLVMVIMGRIGFAVAAAFERAVAEGRSVPDMSGGLPGIISALAVAVPAIGAFIIDQFTRHRERTRQIDRGSGLGPFDHSPPPQPPPDDVLGPRPWENQQ